VIDNLILRLYFRRKVLTDKYLRSRVKGIMSSPIPDFASHPMSYKTISGHHITMLSRYIKALDIVTNKIVLDTGCGLGWGSYILSLRAREVVGMDIDTGSIEYATANWKVKNLTFVKSSALDMYRFPDGIVDVVTSMELIEHFNTQNGLDYFREMFRVLKPDGIIFGSSGFTNDEDRKKSMILSNPDHKHIYSENEFKIMMRDVGFKEVNVFNGWLFQARR